MATWTEFLEPDIGDDRFLSWPKVRDITDISRSTAWRLQNSGEFPLPVVLSPGRVGWSEREVTAWKRSRSPRQDSEARSLPMPPPSASRVARVKPLRSRAELASKTPAQPERPTSVPEAPKSVALMPPVKSSRRARTQAEGQTAFEF